MTQERASRSSRQNIVALVASTVVLAGCLDRDPGGATAPDLAAAATIAANDIDAMLRAYLTSHRFTGRIEETLEPRLGRPIDHELADIGRLLWFDPIQGLNNDNTCGGCHSPSHGFGDTQPIAIGVGNNGIVGPSRAGPRNMRRTPMAINTAFYPTLMWDSRFHARSGDPFDNSRGFAFPAPEGASLSHLPHLLMAQAFIPPTERVEQAGFHFPGDNDDIRNEVLRRLNESSEYRARFARVFGHVRDGGPIAFDDFARAIAEFEFTQTYANAPIDRYARGETGALTASQKHGAVLFFGRAGCVACHAVSGRSNEMFSDFEQHVAGVPQIVPLHTNVDFDGPFRNQDFGLEQTTGKGADRYAFRTSPLRNVALQPAFMHNGAFVRLEDAIRYHLDAVGRASTYTTALLPADLRGPLGPMQPLLARVDKLLRKPTPLSPAEFDALVDFVRAGLLDPRAQPEQLRHLIPDQLPSGRTPLRFE